MSILGVVVAVASSGGGSRSSLGFRGLGYIDIIKVGVIPRV